MKTLYLHIGTPKTATTAIQTFCKGNKKVLDRHGYYYPIFDYVYENVRIARNAHFLLGHNYLKEEERDFAKEDQVIQEGFAHIYEAFERYDNILLSDESIWNLGFKHNGRCWNQIREELEKNIFEMKVIVYLRRQDEFAYSWWKQMVKVGFRSSSVFTWKEMVRKLPVVQLDYYEELEKIAKIVGKENIIVRKFDRSQFIGQTIQADFLNAIGLEFSDEYKITADVTNVSLTNNFNEIKRVLNGLPDLDKKGNDFFKSSLKDLSRQSGSDKKYGMLSEQELKKFMAKYEEGNRKIAQEYMGGSEKLFDENYKVEEKWSPVNPEMIEDLVKLFGMTTLTLMKKNEELERQVSTWRDKMKHPLNTVGNKIMSSLKKTQ